MSSIFRKQTQKKSRNNASGWGVWASAVLIVVSLLSLSAPLQAQHPSPAALATEQVNINAADAETIADVLVGVGDSKAKAIVEFREQNGPFTSVDQLTEVNGIGEAILSQNRERITLE